MYTDDNKKSAARGRILTTLKPTIRMQHGDQR